jgi:predicted RNA methylase
VAEDNAEAQAEQDREGQTTCEVQIHFATPKNLSWHDDQWF